MMANKLDYKTAGVDIEAGYKSVELMKEQMEEMQQERDKIEAERLESQKMMEELMALKEQLAKQTEEDKTAGED